MPSIMDEIAAPVPGALEQTETLKIGLEQTETLTTNKMNFDGLFNLFKAKSSDKPVEEYQEHPLNFDKKKSTGRIIRGLEGLLGALNYAIVDIIMGFIEKSKEAKNGA